MTFQRKKEKKKLFASKSGIFIYAYLHVHWLRSCSSDIGPQARYWTLNMEYLVIEQKEPIHRLQ